MTALQIQFAPHFLVPVTEDLMELTSDMDQRAGGADDIDIDLDLTGDIQQDGEDEFMDEEDMNALADSTSADRQETHATNDDEMVDDDSAQGLIDEASSVRDEDIEDAEYTGPGLDEDTVVQPDTDYPNEQSEELLADYEEIAGNQNHEQVYQDQEYNEQEHRDQLTAPETDSGFVEGALPNERTESSNSSHDAAKVATGKTSEGHHLQISKEATVNHAAADGTSDPSDVEGLVAPKAKFEQVREEVLPVPLDQEAVARSSIEESHTQDEDPLNSPVHLHPIVLDYQGDGMFLFPPVDQNGEHAATFLLADEQLAYSTIGNLFEACRDVLKGSLSGQDELVINIHDLDLQISESTIECASTKFSEVVDLYFRLQQNDGLESPPPLYLDLTTRNRFSCRLSLLRNALLEGTGLTQLKSSQETEIGQLRKAEGETDPSNCITVLPSNDAYVSEQQPGEEGQGSMDQYDSHGNTPPSEDVLPQTDSSIEGTQLYPIEDVAHKGNDRTEPLLRSDSSTHEAGIIDGFSNEAAGSKESLEPAKTLPGDSELQKVEGLIVDDGDLIDYEDVEELEGGTSSASSTLQGDTSDVPAVQDHGPPNELDFAQNQEDKSSPAIHGDVVADEITLHEYVDEKDTSDVGLLIEEEQPDAAEVSPHYSDEKGQSLSRQFDEEKETSENSQDASTSQGTESQLKINADDRHKASAHDEEDVGSYWQNTLREHADRTEGDARPLADIINNGEVDDHLSIYPLDSKSSGSRRNFHDDDLGRFGNLEAENELEDGDGLLTNDDSDDARQLPEETNSRPLLFVGESTQTQEDDDEITYEDEEYDVDSPYEPARANHNVATNPGPLKRVRSLHEDDGTLEEDLQGAKRIRSG